MKRILINIDDVGISSATNRAAWMLCKIGLIRSISIMPNAPYFMDAVSLFKNIDCSVGVHLTMTSEWKGLKTRPLAVDSASLCNSLGYFHSTVDKFHKYAIDSHIRNEILTQIKHVEDAGLEVRHLDTHMLFYEGRDDILHILLDIAKEKELPVLLYDARLIALAKDRGVLTPDYGDPSNYFFEMNHLWVEYVDFVKKYPAYELGVFSIHPSLSSNESLTIMGAEGYKRPMEFDLFSNPVFIQSLGVEVVDSRILKTRIQ